MMMGLPPIERRDGEDRRNRTGWQMFWDAAGSPVSVVLLVVSLIASLTTVIRNADGALQSTTFYSLRERDSIATYYRDQSRDQQFLTLQTQLNEVRAALSVAQTRDDSLLRYVRREACRRDPRECE